MIQTLSIIYQGKIYSCHMISDYKNKLSKMSGTSFFVVDNYQIWHSKFTQSMRLPTNERINMIGINTRVAIFAQKMIHQTNIVRLLILKY